MRILPIEAYLRTLRGIMGNLLRREAVYPFYASLKVTSHCQFACPFCNVKKSRATDLSTKDIIKILDNLSRSSVLMTSFEGGEPLLRSDIGTLLRYARTRRFYLLFTTSARNLMHYPLKEYAPFIDFLHVSIDEGHNNVEMFDLLPELVRLPTQVSVQTVVTRQSLSALEEKVRRCHAVGAGIVIIAATVMDNAEDHFPDMAALEREVLRLRQCYPGTIHTPPGYFKAYRRGRCSSASIIIAPTGELYYPCHILGTLGPDLRHVDLMTWLRSLEARRMRHVMRTCSRNCGWYQYYAIESYTSLTNVYEALKPALRLPHRRPTTSHSPPPAPKKGSVPTVAR